jgi:tetratricopeptide (TPR) repeat protein
MRPDVIPGNADWQRDLSVSHERIGYVERAQDNLPAALNSYQAALAIRERMAKADPGNADWQRVLAWSYGRVALVIARQGDSHSALSAYRQGREIIVRLTKQSPDDAMLNKHGVWRRPQVDWPRFDAIYAISLSRLT